MNNFHKVFKLSKIMLRVNITTWNHYSIFLFSIVIMFAAGVLEGFSNGGKIELYRPESYIGSILVDSIIAVFSCFIINFGLILFDVTNKEIKTGELLNYFTSFYSRKDIMLAKLLIIYVEFIFIIVACYFSIVLGLFLTIDIIKMPENFFYSYFYSYMRYLLYFSCSILLIGGAIIIPLFTFICYKFRTYWFVFFVGVFEGVSFIFLLAPILAMFLLHKNNPNVNQNDIHIYSISDINLIRKMTLGLGGVSPYYMTLFFESLILPKAILTKTTLFILILGLLPNKAFAPNNFFTHNEILIYSIYSLVAIIFGIVFLFFSQRHLYFKKWFV